MSTACESTCTSQGGEALPSPLRVPLSAMRSGFEPLASVRGLSLDGSDTSLSLGKQGLCSMGLQNYRLHRHFGKAAKTLNRVSQDSMDPFGGSSIGLWLRV